MSCCSIAALLGIGALHFFMSVTMSEADLTKPRPPMSPHAPWIGAIIGLVLLALGVWELVRWCSA